MNTYVKITFKPEGDVLTIDKKVTLFHYPPPLSIKAAYTFQFQKRECSFFFSISIIPVLCSLRQLKIFFQLRAKIGEFKAKIRQK